MHVTTDFATNICPKMYVENVDWNAIIAKKINESSPCNKCRVLIENIIKTEPFGLRICKYLPRNHKKIEPYKIIFDLMEEVD